MKKISLFLVLSLALLFCDPARLKAEENSLAPNFKLPDLSGEVVELSSYKNSQAVLLFFWTTWCPYCLREIRILNSRIQNLQAKGIEILAINAGESQIKVKRLMQNYDLDLKVLLDEKAEVADSYGVLGVPTFVLIDKKGRVIFIDNYFPHQEISQISG